MTNTTIKTQMQRAEATADKHQARDLFLIISNDGDIYRQSITPTIKNLNNKVKKGNFDRVQAVQGFYNVVLSALKNPMFDRYYSYNINVVDVPTRYAVAVELLEYFIEEIEEV